MSDKKPEVLPKLSESAEALLRMLDLSTKVGQLPTRGDMRNLEIAAKGHVPRQ